MAFIKQFCLIQIRVIVDANQGHNCVLPLHCLSEADGTLRMFFLFFSSTFVIWVICYECDYI